VTRTQRTLPALLAAAALAAAGCGGNDGGSKSSGSHSTPAKSSGAAAAPGQIKMQNIAFDPKNARVHVGEKVTWTDAESIPHNVVAQSGASFKSETFGKGGTFSWTPTKPGTVTYECTLHPGMVATIEVVPKGQ
jgi:plastocyanin